MFTTPWPSHRRARNVTALILGALVLAGTGPAARAVEVAQDAPQAVVDVAIGDHSFYPSQLTIPVGTTVRWTNFGASPHTSTSDTGAWDSGTLSRGGTSSHTFTAAGMYRYHCTFHQAMGMVGRIIVTDVNSPPPVPDSTRNLAAGRPVRASSAQAGHPPSHAADGHTGTYWASEPGGGANSQWIYVDLGATRSVQRFRMLWTAAGRPGQYGVYTYAAACGGWCPLAWIRTGDGDDTLTLSRAVSSRYVLLLMQYPAGGFGAHELRELEVFGGTSSPPTSTMNVALGRPAYASTAMAGGPPAYATDGNLATSWQSAGLPAWIYVDLGRALPIDHAVLRWVGGRYASRFAVYAWNGSVGWYAVHSTVSNGSVTNTVAFQPLQTRYLLVFATGGPSSVVGLRELEIHGFADAPFVADLAEGTEWEAMPEAPLPDVVPEGSAPDADAPVLGGDATRFDELAEPGALDQGGRAPDGLPDLGGDLR